MAPSYTRGAEGASAARRARGENLRRGASFDADPENPPWEGDAAAPPSTPRPRPVHGLSTWSFHANFGLIHRVSTVKGVGPRC
jgi:hypothetical protein